MNGAEALAMGCTLFFSAPPAFVGLVAAVFAAALAGSGKLTVGPAALWLTLALALVEFGGFQIIDMMSV
jgi:hypothetical protein